MIYQIGETKRQKGGMTVQLNKALDLWVVLCNNFEGGFRMAKVMFKVVVGILMVLATASV